MAKTECKTCAWEKEAGAKVDSTRAHTAWAQEVGVSEASIRRHLAHSPVAHQVSAFVDANGDLLASQIDVPEEYITSRGMSIRDPLTNSWQKINWQPNKKALHDTLRYDDLKEALVDWSYEGKPGPLITNQKHVASVLNVADLQIGKANQRWGGTPETLASARASIARWVEYIIQNGIEYAIIADNGDPIENCFNVPSQLVTNDLSVPDQIRTFRRLMLEAIKLVAPHVRVLIYITHPSNHGAHRTGYKSPGGTVDADFGLEISYQLEDATNENPYLKHLTYVRPKPLDETAELQVLGTKLAFNHGHQSKGVFGHGNWWKGMDHGRMAGWDADIFVFGHYHTQATYQSGDGRWVVATASSDPGSDWYTNRTGESSTRGMTTFDIYDGEPGVPQNVRII